MTTLLEKLKQDLANGQLSEETKAEAVKEIGQIIKTDIECRFKSSDANEHAFRVFEINWKEIAEYDEKKFADWLITRCRNSCNHCWTIWKRDYSMPMCARGLLDTWGD